MVWGTNTNTNTSTNTNTNTKQSRLIALLLLLLLIVKNVVQNRKMEKDFGMISLLNQEQEYNSSKFGLRKGVI